MFQPTFLDKEAAFGLPNAIGSRIIRNLDELKPVKGTDTFDLHYLNADELAAKAKERNKQDGNGMVGDVALWTLGKLTPNKWGAKEKALDILHKGKEVTRKYDTQVAGKLTKKMKDDGMLAKMMSVPETRVVAESTGNRLYGTEPKELSEVYRRSSLLAPAQNTAKVTAPILGSMYAAEKMYPKEEQLAGNHSDDYEKNGLEMELMTERLDKQAAFQKVSYLEEEIEKLASELMAEKEEKQMFWRESEKERMEKEAALKEKESIENEFLEKNASYEEFKIRTSKRERSKSAVKIAEDMLEEGIIKQAEFNKKVDFLMDCDNKTFNLYSSMTKHAQSDEKGLESSPFFVDYRSKEEESTSQRQKRGLSKEGQTIGEAARDLHK